jgi:NitT/TauT family transport system substrate-binding protein
LLTSGTKRPGDWNSATKKRIADEPTSIAATRSGNAGAPSLRRRAGAAFLRGVRAHNDALGSDGAFLGEKGDEIVSILTEYGAFKDPKVWRSFVFSSCGPDGTLHVPSMKEDLAIWRQQGLIEVAIEVEKALDTSFVEWAVKDLGPYVKK